MTTPPLLLLELLADRTLNPKAIALHFSPCEDRQLIPLINDETFTTLTQVFSCHIPADRSEVLAPETLSALQEAGCSTITGEEIHKANGIERPSLPESINWLSGQWYMATPAKPPVNQTASRSLELKLLQLVANDAETREIEEVFRRDPVLAYHLLRLVNSLGSGTNRNVSSFSQAILILGRQQLKRWLNLMLFAANRNDHRSAMLMARVAVRARSMELLAAANGFDTATCEKAFMVGMFSLLGVLFGLPLEKVLAPLNLNDTLSAAVLKNSGEIGHLKQIVETAERLDHKALYPLIEQVTGLSVDGFNRITLEAHSWMHGIINGKQESADA